MRNTGGSYETRFIREEHRYELLRLFVEARVGLANQHGCSRYDRMLWAAREFVKVHPGVTSGEAYKDLCGLLA